MVFRDNFKRFIEEKTGMKTSNFLKELGMSYSVVKSLDEEGIEALTEKQLNLVEWDGHAAKYDLRPWTRSGEPAKGITLSLEELAALHEIIGAELEKVKA